MLIAIHAVLGFLALQVFLPLAVVVAAIGKSWFPEYWLKAHWKLQVYLVVPTTVITIILSGIAAGVNPDKAKDVWDKHRVMGFVLLSVIVLQCGAGLLTHKLRLRKERFAVEHGLPDPPPKRRLINWIHIAVGIFLLSVGGLQVTWGFGEYESHLGEPVPRWVEIVHYVIAGIPVLLATPFILVRGVMRMRDGHSFAAAFFASPSPEPSYPPPPRQLFLGTSSYLDESYGPGGLVFDADKDGVGHEYAKGAGADGRMRVQGTHDRNGASEASYWPGATTREEYEADVQSHRDSRSFAGFSMAPSVVSTAYDPPPSTEEHSALLSAAEPMGHVVPAASASDESARPSQPAPPVPATYPPSAPPPALPPMSPLYSSASPTPSALFSSTNAPPAVPPLPASFSPRLSFMPFAGSDAAHPPPENHRHSAASSLHSLVPPTAAAGQLPPLSSPKEGEGKSASPIVLVPSPPPPPPALAPAAPMHGRAPSVATVSSTQALCGGDPAPPVPPLPTDVAATESPTVQRHQSVEGKIESVVSDPAVPAIALPLPEEEENDDAHSVASNDDVPLTVIAGGGRDSESTRLMDELERELTISTMRTGRSKFSFHAAEAEADAAGGDTESKEDDEPEKEKEEKGKAADAMSVASGMWMGSGM
ncbi:hypothetical protein JCM10207_002757 [Rhodosporidiobolus poonsookiae]